MNALAGEYIHFVGQSEGYVLEADSTMDIKFKITADGRLAIKQAHPWID